MGNFGEQNNPHPSPLLHSLFSTGSLNSNTTLHGGGGEGEANIREAL